MKTRYIIYLSGHSDFDHYLYDRYSIHCYISSNLKFVSLEMKDQLRIYTLHSVLYPGIYASHSKDNYRLLMNKKTADRNNANATNVGTIISLNRMKTLEIY